MKLVNVTSSTDVDETWVNLGHTVLSNHHDNAATTPKDAFLTAPRQD